MRREHKPSLRARFLSALLGVAVIVGGAIWVVRSASELSAERRAALGPTKSVLAEAPVETPVIDDSNPPAPEPVAQAPPAEEVKAVTAPVPSSSPALKRSPEYQHYLSVGDPSVLFREGSRLGSADDKYYASEALRFCADWVMPPRRSQDIPGGLFRLRYASFGPFKKFALAEVERCKGFLKLEAQPSALAAMTRREAADAGSLPAIAIDLASLRKSDPAVARATAIRVLESRDAAAVANLWPYLEADNAYSRMTEIDPILRQLAERMRNAWLTMACANGLDCGPKSTVMKSVCMAQEGPACEPFSYAEMVERRNGATFRADTDRIARFYADVIRKGEWKRLGLGAD